MIKPICYRCKKELEEYGAILLSPPIDPLKDPSEVDILMDAETYDRFCEDRGS